MIDLGQRVTPGSYALLTFQGVTGSLNIRAPLPQRVTQELQKSAHFLVGKVSPAYAGDLDFGTGHEYCDALVRFPASLVAGVTYGDALAPFFAFDKVLFTPQIKMTNYQHAKSSSNVGTIAQGTAATDTGSVPDAGDVWKEAEEFFDKLGTVTKFVAVGAAILGVAYIVGPTDIGKKVTKALGI
jgi:hypothetical protein